MLSASSSSPAQVQAGPVIAGNPPQPAPPAEPPKRKYYWGPMAGVFYALATFFGAQFGAYFILALGWRQFGGDPAAITDTIQGQFMFVLLAELLAVGGIIWFVHRRRASLTEVGLDRPKLRYIGYGLGGYAIYFGLYLVAIGVAYALYPSLNIDQPQNIGFDNPVGDSQLLLTFISLAILPPIAEEVVFRGFMFKGLRAKLPFIWATLITSALFAAGHLEFGGSSPLLWVAAIDTFVLSVVLCFIREKTDSIWSGVLVHAIKNSVAFVMLYLIVS